MGVYSITTFGVKITPHATGAIFRKKYGDNPDRPPFWGGWRIKPLEIEFWADGEARLHDRFKWSRETLNEAIGMYNVSILKS